MALRYKFVATEYGTSLKLETENSDENYRICVDRDDNFVMLFGGDEPTAVRRSVLPWRDYFNSLVGCFDYDALLEADLFVFYQFMYVASVCPAVVELMLSTDAKGKEGLVNTFIHFIGVHDVHIKSTVETILDSIRINNGAKYDLDSNKTKAALIVCNDAKLDYTAYVVLFCDNTLTMCVERSGERIAANFKLPAKLQGLTYRCEMFFGDYKFTEELTPAKVYANQLRCAFSMCGIYVDDVITGAPCITSVAHPNRPVNDTVNVIDNFNDLHGVVYLKLSPDAYMQYYYPKFGVVKFNDEHKVILQFDVNNAVSEYIIFDGKTFRAMSDSSGFLNPTCETGGLDADVLLHSMYAVSERSDQKIFIDKLLFLNFMCTAGLTYVYRSRDKGHNEIVLKRLIVLFQSFMFALGYTVLATVNELYDMIHIEECYNATRGAVNILSVLQKNGIEICGIQLTETDIRMYYNDDPDSYAYNHVAILHTGMHIPSELRVSNTKVFENRAILGYQVIRGMLALLDINHQDRENKFYCGEDRYPCSVFSALPVDTYNIRQASDLIDWCKTYGILH